MTNDTTAQHPVPTRVAASLLSLHPSTISRMVKEGRMTPAFRTGDGRGHQMLFTLDEIERVRELVSG